jgi:protein tyrosine/serine phosphatase
MQMSFFSRGCYGAVVLFAIAFALPGAAAAGGPDDQTVATAPAIRIDNFGRVDASLYRGAQPEERDFTDLKALGVRTIVDLTSDDADPNEKAMVEAAGMKYVTIPMTTHDVPTADQLAQFLGILSDSTSGPVFVHCVGGRHRTGVMTAVYRMTREGWTGEQAFQEMKQYKFGPDFLHPEFKRFVYGYLPVAAAVAAVAAVPVR